MGEQTGILNKTHGRRGQIAPELGDELFRRVLEGAPDAILVHDRHGHLLDVNRTTCRSLGYPRHELLAMTVFDIEVGLSPDVLEGLWEGVDHGESVAVEGRERRRNGSTFPVEVSFSRLLAGGQDLVIAFVRDITERKQVEARLRASEDRSRQLAAIVEASDDAIFSVDPELQRITYWNKGAQKLWGWAPEEAIGQPFWITTSPDRREVLREIHRKLADGTPHVRYDRVGIRKDGGMLDVSVSVFPVRDTEGRILNYSSIQRDVSDLKQALEEVALKTAQLEAARDLSRLKDHFLSTISHELKTPLTLIVGNAELLEEACPATRDLVRGIQDGCRRLTDHIGNMVDYSALLSGTLAVYRTDVDLAEATLHASEIAADRIQQKGLDLRLEVEPESLFVLGDSRRITQVLVELLDNAVKVSERGGCIGIRASSSRGQVRLDVWDTGPGIPEREFPRIWEAFSQLEVGDTLRLGGLGLGLSLVKQLVELHGGRVGLVSREGTGTVFSMFLPESGGSGTPN